ncbi:crotonase/enoyl-CoA hydratase family protein [Georgenia halophila]|uniref:Crotonase/enoyl-CoA hydratase family protein n=1 Tax=Georgenia halophila TaxID=620889 RepID=A0ABP8LLB6_9MICO
MTTGTDKVLIEHSGPVVLVTINRPDARNAVDLDVARALGSVFADIDADDAARVAVLSGAGGTFCAGADLKASARGEQPVTTDGGFGGITRTPPATPTIAAVEGFAVAGGLELALACDLIVAAEDAKLGLPEVKRGLAAAGGGLLRLPRRIPYHLAMELALTGEPITADRAHALGLVNRVTPHGAAREAAIELAEHIASNGPLAVRASKQVVARQSSWTDDVAWEEQEKFLRPVFDSADAKEGPLAFAEKRPPVWTGR